MLSLAKTPQRLNVHHVTCCKPLCMLFISKALLILARHRTAYLIDGGAVYPLLDTAVAEDKTMQAALNHPARRDKFR
jgi:hypothetical protein